MTTFRETHTEAVTFRGEFTYRRNGEIIRAFALARGASAVEAHAKLRANMIDYAGAFPDFSIHAIEKIDGEGNAIRAENATPHAA